MEYRPRRNPEWMPRVLLWALGIAAVWYAITLITGL